ncbi:MAG: recombination protein RecR [Bacteroidia bacterium]|nr:recombination protein RecR [Bacteroidia bacterium]
MNNMPTKLLDDAVEAFMRLPGIGRRTAMRMVLHLLRQPEAESERFGNAIERMRKETHYCNRCNNICDEEVCGICNDSRRDASLVCVVEDIRDLIAIEHTQQYRGRYHVLGGVISPMDGIGPSDIYVDSLIHRLKHAEIDELIMALSATMEGDTTSFFIYRKIQQAGLNTKFSVIARGVSIGDDLEYADEVTLGRSILNRVPYETTFASNSKF